MLDDKYLKLLEIAILNSIIGLKGSQYSALCSNSEHGIEQKTEYMMISGISAMVLAWLLDIRLRLSITNKCPEATA